MNKIETLPKSIFSNEDDERYDISMWLTVYNHLCIGYRHETTGKILFSVCIEPEGEVISIAESCQFLINKDIGVAHNIDDACDELQNYISNNDNIFDCYV